MSVSSEELKPMKFFNQFDRFYGTSSTSPFPNRLNGRYHAIFAENAERFAKATVLDIASHDGRWSFAAVKNGAASVIGVEPRSELVANAFNTFELYGVERSRFQFVECDVFQYLNDSRRFDIVLCLGFFYHTARHVELMDRMERTGATFVVLDTEVTPLCEEMPVPAVSDPRAVFGNPYGLQLLRDNVAEQQMAIADSAMRGGYTLVARPSRAAIRLLAEHFGFRCKEYDWQEYFSEHPEARDAMADYSEGWRTTYFLYR